MATIATTTHVRLGPEDKVRKQKMVDDLKLRNLLSPSAEKFILRGRRK